MFGSKTRRIADQEQRIADQEQRIADQEQRIARLHEQLAEARTDAAAHLGASIRTAGRNVVLSEQLEAAQRTAASETRRNHQLGGEFVQMVDRLERLLRGCVRYRAELAEQHRVVRGLTDQLLSAMGYDDAGLKRLEVTEPARQEPGLAEEVTA